MRRSIIAAAMAMSLAFSATALAEGNPIAVVNIQQIMKESTAAKGMREQLEGKQKTFQAELSKKEDTLKKEDQELGKQKNVLAKDAFETKARAFREKVTDLQKEAKSKKTLLDNAANQAWITLQKSLADVVAEIAKEKGFQLAIPTDAPPTWQVLYADSKLDISAEVLERLNKKLPKVDVKFEDKK